MAPVVEIRGAEGAEVVSLGHIVRLSTYALPSAVLRGSAEPTLADVRRLGGAWNRASRATAWNRVGTRTSSRGVAAIARREAMRGAISRSAHVVVRQQTVAVAELAPPDMAVSAAALCARPVRAVRGFDAAELRVLCAAA